jgi:hypothetical protein
MYCFSEISDEAIVKPFIFEFDADLNPVVSMKFLCDKDSVKKAIAKVASIEEAGTKLKTTCRN